MAEDRGSGGVVKRIRSDYFDEDIVSEILARLPVRSLLRFRCVCKSWRALIADSHFVKKHSSYAERGIGDNNSKLLFLMNPPLSIDYEALKDLKEGGDGWFARRELHFPVKLAAYQFMHERIRILGSCNGLICVECQGVGIVVWNPCTGEYKVLPNPPTDCHPSDFYGFGYDSTTDDYKIIRGRRSSEEALIHVFTLKTGSWRTTRDHDYAEFWGKGCLFNGALHWLVSTYPGSRIMSFCVAEEKFEETVPLLDDYHVFHGVLVYKDHLCVYQILDGIPAVLSVWLMEEYGAKESWTQVIKFSLKKLRGEELKPLCILQNGEILMHRVMSDDPFEFNDPADVFDVDLDELYYEQLMQDDPDVFNDDPGMFDEDLDELYYEQLMQDDPDVFDDDPGVFDEDLDELYYEQLMQDDPDVFDDDPGLSDEDLDTLYNQQCMWNAESLLVLTNQKTSKAVFEVDLGFGAATYRQTLVSPVTGI
ncbi:F-box/kelch-repeat protein At3g06240-like [Rosa rugosa]|uniref:F-box/kelch-repeat protein At3g06240-like n=1 Tax=Rosa rugosa TaxID=74645 RepID=UPI002B4014A8|nr:F-box/kelch-repeat protein At3g06240-like [Rosa rugosa]